LLALDAATLRDSSGVGRQQLPTTVITGGSQFAQSLAPLRAYKTKVNAGTA
jgi:hypothetical protein